MTRRRRNAPLLRLPVPKGDTLTINGHGMFPVTSKSASAYVADYIKLAPYLGTSDVTLGNNIPVLAGIYAAYDGWTVTNLTVTIIPVLSATDGTMIAVGLDPICTGEPKVPMGLTDVVMAAHTAVSNQNTKASFSCNPSLYHNDWNRSGPSVSYSESTTGYLQVYSPYSSVGADKQIAFLDIRCTFVFAGLKA